MELFFKRVHILVWVLLQDISDLIQLSRMVQRTYFIIYEFCFTCFKVECKRSCIFQSSSSNVRELNGKKVVDQLSHIHCFTEWNNMI